MNISEALLTGKGVTLSDAFSFGSLTAVLGMGIVFAVLVVLMIVLYLFKVIFHKQPKKQEVTATPVQETAAEPENEMDDDELIAVLTAAVAASLNTSTYNLNIKSYRRIDNTRPAWNREGLRETINNRF